MYIYAIIDDSNTCVGVSYLCGEVSQSNMIKINSTVAKTVIGRKYQSGSWVQQEIPAPVIQRQEVIAKNATFLNGRDIDVSLNDGDVVNNGTLLKFVAPCDCAAFKGMLWVGYDQFSIVDALGRDYGIIEHGSIWAEGSKLSVLIDCNNRLAYLQNAAETVNSVVEIFSNCSVEDIRGNVFADEQHIRIMHSVGLGISFFSMTVQAQGLKPQESGTVCIADGTIPNGDYKCWSSHDLFLHCEVQKTPHGFNLVVTNIGGSTVEGVVNVFGWYFT